VPLHEERQTIDLAYDRGRMISAKGIARAVRAVRHFDRLGDKAQSRYGPNCRHRSDASSQQSLHGCARTPYRDAFDDSCPGRATGGQFAAKGALIGLSRVSANPIVIDIGGGSSQFIQPQTNAFRGLPIGAAWATKRWKESSHGLSPSATSITWRVPNKPS